MTMPISREEPDWILIKTVTKTNAPFQEVTSRYLMRELSTEQVVQHVGSDSLHTYSHFLTSITDPCHRESIKILTRKISRAFSRGSIPSNLPQSLQAYLRFLTWVADPKQENSMKLLLNIIDRPFSQRKIPSSLWGYIASFAPPNDALALRQVCTRFSSPEFSKVAFKGRENDAANRILRKLIHKKMPLENRLLEALASNVTTLDLSELPITADIITELAKLFPHTTTLILENIENPNAAEIIPHLSNFKNLQILSFSISWPSEEINFSDIKHHLKRLPQTLTSLRLKSLDLHDEDIGEFAHLSTLQKLDIEENGAVTGKTFHLLPSTVVYLNCSYCGVTDEAIPKLSHLEQLQRLKIDHTRGSRIDPKGGMHDVGSPQGTTFQHLPSSLLELDCSFCDINDAAIAQLSHLKRLQKLNLGDTLVTGSTFEHLPSSLLELNFYDEQGGGDIITDEVIPNLSHLENLRVLTISSSNVEGSTFEYLPSSLRTLVCSECKLTDETITKLSRLENLENLSIFFNSSVKGSTFEHLPSSIRFLELQGCELTDVAITKLSRLENLENLSILNSRGVKGSTFEHLPSSIRFLEFQGCELTDEAITKLSRLENLENLSILYSRGVKGSTFEHLPSSIRFLKFQNCALTDEAITKLSRLENLENLSILNSRGVKGSTFEHLPSSIRFLELENCELTDEAIVKLARLEKLESLLLIGNKSISETTLQNLPPTVSVSRFRS